MTRTHKTTTFFRRGTARARYSALGLALCLALVLGFCPGLTGGAARAEDPAYLTLGAGVFDINDDDKAGDFRVEYRSNWSFLYLKPFIGLMGTTDKAIYAYGGLGLDLYFGKRIVVTPNAAVGAFGDGDGKDLGHTVEFRTGVEVAYRFDNRSRLGIAFHHISNASLGDLNPGTELLAVTYSMPFRDLVR